MSLFGVNEKDIKYRACDVNVFLQKPERINIIEGKYLILVSTTGADPFDNMNMGINLLASNGWKCNCMFSYKERLVALMERL